MRWTPHRLPDGHHCFAEDTCLSEFMRQSGRLDHDQAFLAKICSHIRPGTVVIDGGAFLGDHAVAYAKIAKTVYAFEPHWPSYLGLCTNVFVGRHFNVIPLHEALGNNEDYVVMFADEMPPNVGAIVPEYSKHAERPRSELGETWTVSLDSFTKTQLSTCGYGDEWNDRVGLIKLDLEGNEVRAIRGARDTIKRDQPILVLEVNEGALQKQGVSARHLIELVESLGYRWQCVKGTLPSPCADVIFWHPDNPYPDNA